MADERKANPWTTGIFTTAIGAMGPAGLYYVLIGEMHFKKEWQAFIYPFGAFLLTGLFIQGIFTLYLAIKKDPDWEARSNSLWEWWLGKVGCGIVLLIGSIIGLIFLYVAGSSLFEGVGKGTALVIVLLVMILFALLRIGNRLRR